MQVTDRRRFLELPGLSKADSWSLWTHSLKAYQNPKSRPGQGSRGGTRQPEMLSPRCKSRSGWGWATFCFALNRSSLRTQRRWSSGCVCRRGGAGACLLPGQRAIQARDVVHEWKHSSPLSSHASLSLGALILCCCCPLLGAEEEAASVLIPLCSSSLEKQKARFKARFSAANANLR